MTPRRSRAVFLPSLIVVLQLRTFRRVERVLREWIQLLPTRARSKRQHEKRDRSLHSAVRESETDIHKTFVVRASCNRVIFAALDSSGFYHWIFVTIMGTTISSLALEYVHIWAWMRACVFAYKHKKVIELTSSCQLFFPLLHKHVPSSNTSHSHEALKRKRALWFSRCCELRWNWRAFFESTHESWQSEIDV